MDKEFSFPNMPEDLKKMLENFGIGGASNLQSIHDGLEKVADTIDDKPLSDDVRAAISILSSDLIDNSLRPIFNKVTIVELSLIADTCHHHIRLGRLLQRYLDEEKDK